MYIIRTGGVRFAMNKSLSILFLFHHNKVHFVMIEKVPDYAKCVSSNKCYSTQPNILKIDSI